MIEHNIDYCNKVAKNKNGQCLSLVYTSKALLWKCNGCNNEWHTSIANVLNGGWCRNCQSNQKHTINTLQNFAKIKKGKLLSTEYKNGKQKLTWECKFGHTWDAIFINIQKGKWCPVCSKNKKLTINDAYIIAKERGGECLSTEYINAHGKLEWKCCNGHKWMADIHHIKRGRWCPECSNSLGERMCRAYFEFIFEKLFPSVWPKWLINDDGNIMQLDGFCEELGIAFEHNGEQHYYKTLFCNTDEKFLKRQKDDETKIKLCNNKNIRLIIIPQIFGKIEKAEIKKFIIKECLKQNIFISSNKYNKDIDEIKFNNIYNHKATNRNLRRKTKEYLNRI